MSIIGKQSNELIVFIVLRYTVYLTLKYCVFKNIFWNRTQAFEWYQFEWPWVVVRTSAISCLERRVSEMVCHVSIGGSVNPAPWHLHSLVVKNVAAFPRCPRFYRATRMHSADYAVARCSSVCLSVCHTPVLGLNGYRYPQSFFTIG